MKVSEIIARFSSLIEQHGDIDVYLDIDEMGVRNIKEIDIDIDDTGIMIWPTEETAECPENRINSACVCLLSLVQIKVDESIVTAWSDDQYWQAIAWAAAVELVASDFENIEVPPKPTFLEQYQ